MAGHSSGPIDTSDIRGNGPEYIEQAAKYLKHSPQRRQIFTAIYQNKSSIKTVTYLMEKTGYTRVRVLQLGDQLDAYGLVVKTPTKGGTGYKKINFFSKNYRRILDFAEHPTKLKKLVTKRNPSGLHSALVRVLIPPRATIKEIFIDDLFERVRRVRKIANAKHIVLPENKVKTGIQKIIGETGVFKDWPGEKSDLYTTKVRLFGKRIASAIAFKGRATKGKLTPEKMGKRGDQITRLFEEPAQLFLIVFDGQIDTYIKSQMQASALFQATKGQKIYYGIIDGDDLQRLVQAYPQMFA